MIHSNSSPIEGGSGICIQNTNSITLNNNMIINNLGGGEGGGGYFENCTEVNINGNTITGNAALAGWGI